MKTTSYKLVKDTIISLISILVALVPFLVLAIVGVGKIDHRLNIYLFYGGILTFWVLKGLFSALLKLLTAHVIFDGKFIGIRPLGRLKVVRLRPEQIVSVVRITNESVKPESPLFYELCDNHGKTHRIYSDGMLNRDRRELDRILRQKITKGKWNKESLCLTKKFI